MNYLPTASELENALPHIKYEAEMLLWCYLWHRKPENRTASKMLRDAVCESALLHARNLFHVLCNEASRNDDVVAEHYGQLRASLPTVKTFLALLNKWLAHVTYSRAKGSEQPEWPAEKLLAPLFAEAEAFGQYLDNNWPFVDPQEQLAWQDLVGRLSTSKLDLLTPSPSPLGYNLGPTGPTGPFPSP